MNNLNIKYVLIIISGLFLLSGVFFVSKITEKNIKNKEVVILKYSIIQNELIISIDGSIKKKKIDQDQLEKNISAVNDYLNLDRFENPRNNKIELIKNLEELYGSLFQEIERIVPRDKILCFQIEDDLQEIPFHLLYDNGKFLLEKYYLFFITGNNSFSEINDRKPYSYADLKSRDAKAYSDKEGLKIKSALGIELIPTLSEKSTILNLKEAFSNCRSLYITTHGVLNEETNEKYWLELDTGKVNVLEIQDYSNNCEFIFVNACNSASKYILPEKLFKTGVKTMIGSMWEHPSMDRATGNVVRRFYKNWAKGKTKVEALIDAQRETLQRERFANHDSSDKYRKEGDHPYYWGQFILIGDWR